MLLAQLSSFLKSKNKMTFTEEIILFRLAFRQINPRSSVLLEEIKPLPLTEYDVSFLCS
jgi:hypothetical protein